MCGKARHGCPNCTFYMGTCGNKESRPPEVRCGTPNCRNKGYCRDCEGQVRSFMWVHCSCCTCRNCNNGTEFQTKDPNKLSNYMR